MRRTTGPSGTTETQFQHFTSDMIPFLHITSLAILYWFLAEAIRNSQRGHRKMLALGIILSATITVCFDMIP